MKKKRFTHHTGVLLSEAMYIELVKLADDLEIGVSEYVRGLVSDNLRSLASKATKNGKPTNGTGKARSLNGGGAKE